MRVRWWRRRRNPGYTVPCPADCRRQHLHIGPGMVFYAPLNDDGTPGEWRYLGATKEADQ